MIRGRCYFKAAIWQAEVRLSFPDNAITGLVLETTVGKNEPGLYLGQWRYRGADLYSISKTLVVQFPFKEGLGAETLQESK